MAGNTDRLFSSSGKPNWGTGNIWIIKATANDNKTAHYGQFCAGMGSHHSWGGWTVQREGFLLVAVVESCPLNHPLFWFCELPHRHCFEEIVSFKKPWVLYTWLTFPFPNKEMEESFTCLFWENVEYSCCGGDICECLEKTSLDVRTHLSPSTWCNKMPLGGL